MSKQFDFWLIPASPTHDLWPQQSSTLWSGLLPTEFVCQKGILSKLDNGWTRLIFDPINALHLNQGSSNQIWQSYDISKQFDLWLNLADPYIMNFEPNIILLSGQGIFLTNLVAIRAYLNKLTPGWPGWFLQSFDPIIALHFSQGLFLSSSVAIGHSWAIWPWLIPADLWPTSVEVTSDSHVRL